MVNSQPPEPVIADPLNLNVHSIFRTIQGEGPFTGVPAVFIRLAGCNLQCLYCDTDYTSERLQQTPEEVIAAVLKTNGGYFNDKAYSPRGLAVITGGEPFRQDITELVYGLVDFGFYVQIETNGTLRHPSLDYRDNTSERYGVYLVCSPKTPKVYPGLFVDACCVKYVLSWDAVSVIDGLPTTVLGHLCGRDSKPVARPPEGFNKPIYVQPADTGDPTTNELNLKAAIKSCYKHGYTLQLQIHKILGIQ